MLRIQIIGLALVSALFMSAVMAGSASAAHEFLINGAPITTALKVHSSGLLLLEDTKPPIGTPTQVHCHGFNAGTVGPGGVDLIESITLELLGTKDLILCLFDKNGNCNSGTMPVALALNLPWKTELVLHEGKVRDLILADGHGEPGWNVHCNAIIPEDDCLATAAEPGSTGLENVAGGVLATFDKLTPLATCSVGGAKSGKVEGTVLTENPSATEKLTFD
jgi:hypothetical protein